MQEGEKMPNKAQQINKNKDVIEVCLQTFIHKGVLETRSRDLSTALQLQSGGMYYYFSSMDEAVIACAEEAANILESKLMIPALKELDKPELLMLNLKKRAEKLAPMMKFLVQASTTKKYSSKLQPVLDRVGERYDVYAQRFAKRLNCSVDEIRPYVYMCITAVTNYMIFGDAKFIVSQTELIKKEIDKLKKRMSD